MTGIVAVMVISSVVLGMNLVAFLEGKTDYWSDTMSYGTTLTTLLAVVAIIIAGITGGVVHANYDVLPIAND